MTPPRATSHRQLRRMLLRSMHCTSSTLANSIQTGLYQIVSCMATEIRRSLANLHRAPTAQQGIRLSRMPLFRATNHTCAKPITSYLSGCLSLWYMFDVPKNNLNTCAKKCPHREYRILTMYVFCSGSSHATARHTKG